MTRLPLTEMDFRFHFMTRLHWTLGFVYCNLVESIGHVWVKHLLDSLRVSRENSIDSEHSNKYCDVYEMITLGTLGFKGSSLFCGCIFSGANTTGG